MSRLYTFYTCVLDKMLFVDNVGFKKNIQDEYRLCELGNFLYDDIYIKKCKNDHLPASIYCDL